MGYGALMEPEQIREEIVARIKRSRTPEDQFAGELELLHYDMEQVLIWSPVLTREFSLRNLEIQLSYLEHQRTKSQWKKN